MPIPDSILRSLREFKRYTGDGLPNEPVGAPLPVGDPSSGTHNPLKSDLRESFGGVVAQAEAARDLAQAAAASSGPGVAPAATRSTIAALDVTLRSVAALQEAGKEGQFVLRTASDYTALIAADTKQGLFVQSTNDATKVWVRANVLLIFGEWFGMDASASATVNSDALDVAMAVAMLLGKKFIQVGGGRFKLARQHVLGHAMRLNGLGNNAENGSSYFGPTVFEKAFNGSYLFRLGNSAVLSNFDIVPGTSNTGGGVEWDGARSRCEDVSCFNLTGTAFSLERTTPNMNLWSLIRCRAVDINGNGLVVAQFRPGTPWSSAATYALNAEAYDTVDGRNYKCISAVTVAPGSGTFAAYRAANPSKWALANFQFGAPDTNGGFAQEFEASRCSAWGIKLQNTSDNVIHAVVQNCGNGLQFDYAAFGNRMEGYIEASTTTDVYFGQTAVANEARVSALVPPVVVDDSDVGSRSKNIFWRKIEDGTNAGYMPNGLAAWSPEAETYLDLFSGASFLRAAVLAAYNPSGSVGRLALRVKQSGAPERTTAVFYAEGRVDWRGSANTGNQFHAFYGADLALLGGINGGTSDTPKVAYTTASDQNWKDDDGEIPIEDAIKIVRLMKLHNYHWKPERGGGADQGVFAQELVKIYPNAVTVGGWRHADSNSFVTEDADIPAEIRAELEYVPWTVEYARLVIPMARALQGVLARQDEVDARLLMLETGKPN